MKIKLLSDLHLEGRQGYHLKPSAFAEYTGEDVLVLAGDIDVGLDPTAQAINYFLKQGYPNIIYIHGNHEAYRGTFNGFLKELRLRMKGKPVHILDAEEVVKIQNVSFFGGALWTCFDNNPQVEAVAARFINDFRVIKGWTTNDAIHEFSRQFAFIIKTYNSTPGKKVIVTHFLPAKECIDPKYLTNDPITSALNSYFANDLGSWIKTLTDTTWLHGHTHSHVDIVLGTTRIVANPMGYAKELGTNFNPNLVIEV